MNERSPEPTLGAQRVSDLIEMFQTLEPSGLSDLEKFYSQDAVFRDPFNAVQGREAIRGIFAHMFDALQEPHFVVHDRMLDGEQVFLTWSFYFKIKGFDGSKMQVIEGSSHLRWSLTSEGVWKIDLHRDYWDAAQELYEKFPLLGWVLRLMRKRLASPTPTTNPTSIHQN